MTVIDLYHDRFFKGGGENGKGERIALSTNRQRIYCPRTHIPGGPKGRSLTMAYIDQYNRKYIQIDGGYEPLKETHSFLEID